MDEPELESDPRRRKPAVLWLMLGIGVVVAFAALLFLLHDRAPKHAVGPPAGAPPEAH